jgi:hypothetical protein
MFERDFSSDIALGRQDVLFDKPRQSAEQDFPQPCQQLALGPTAELPEISMGPEHRLLDDIRWADPRPEPPLNLPGSQERQIGPEVREQLFNARFIAAACASDERLDIRSSALARAAINPPPRSRIGIWRAR